MADKTDNGRFPAVVMFVFAMGIGSLLTYCSSVVAGMSKSTRPDIFRVLPSKSFEIPAAVDEIVKAKLRLGMTEDELLATVSSWGFEFKRGSDGLWADYSAPCLVCSESFRSLGRQARMGA